MDVTVSKDVPEGFGRLSRAERDALGIVRRLRSDLEVENARREKSGEAPILLQDLSRERGAESDPEFNYDRAVLGMQRGKLIRSRASDLRDAFDRLASRALPTTEKTATAGAG